MKRGERIKGDKKGFTLIELIAVIAVLALIATIALISVTTIRGRVNEKEYINLVTSIETAAQGYAEETGINKLFVQTLIDKGLLQTDDETKEIRDPRDNSSLNCQIINFENGEAVLGDEENPSCDVSLLSDEAIKIQYSLNSDPSKIKRDLPNDYWFNQAITLSVVSTGTVDLDLTNAQFKWTSPLAPDRAYSMQDLEINNKYVEDTYQVTVTVGDRKYTAYGKVKIDREAPKAYNFIDTAPEDWSPKKKLQFELSDVGSGLAAYALSKSNTQEPTTWTQVNPRGKKNDKINLTQDLGNLGLQEGDYVYIWVKDQVGNVNRDDLLDSDGAGGGGGAGAGGLRFDNVDGIFDNITLTGTPNNTIYSKEVTLTGSFQDKKSGAVAWACSDSSSIPTKWTTITRTTNINNVTCPVKKTANGEYYLFAKDQVGNVGKATYKVENIDDRIDNVLIRDTQSGYRQSTTLKAIAEDTKSGIVGYVFNTSSKKPTNFTRIAATKSLDLSFTADNNVTYYFHVIDGAGNYSYNQVTVKDIVYETSISDTLSNTVDDYISKRISLKGAVKITNYFTDTGNISVSLNNKSSNVTADIIVRNGYTHSKDYLGTCPTTTYPYKATSSKVCTSGYECSKGGEEDDGMCVADRGYEYEITSNPREKQTYQCMANGGWTKISGEDPSTPCADHYSRYGKAYDCNGPTKACKQGEQTTVMFGCSALCRWNGDYSAKCSGTKKTVYKCDDGDYKDYDMCYYCSKTDSYYDEDEGSCVYQCPKSFDYWEYNVTIYYYVLK